MKQPFETLLRTHRLKATPQRLALLEAIHDAGHIGVDALFETLRSAHPTLSLATIYNNLNAMAENGLLTEVKIPGRKQQYEITKTPHTHLLCEVCESLCDVDYAINALLAESEARSGYRLNGALIILTGQCPVCQNKSA